MPGYGKDGYDTGKPSFTLREVDVPIVDGDSCQRRLRGTTLGKHFHLNRKSFICAGGEENKDACEVNKIQAKNLFFIALYIIFDFNYFKYLFMSQGDGGSALICAGADGRGYIAGLVAWGLGCANADMPGVYVNVPNYVPWILSNLD